MRSAFRASCLFVLTLCAAAVALPERAFAQTTSVAPTLIPLSGELRTADGQPRTGTVLLVISLYEGQADPAPRWIEHQVVTLDAAGRYSIQFGATRDDGLPNDLFTGDAATRWLGIAVENEPEQPRVMLVSVPYAAKAATADTLAGKTASDFVLTATFKEDVRAAVGETRTATTSDDPSSSAVNSNDHLQKGTGTGSADSAVIEVGGNVGIGTSTPDAPMDVLTTGSTLAQFGTTNSTGGLVRFNNGDGFPTRGYLGFGPVLFDSAEDTVFGLRSQGDLTFSTGGGARRMTIGTAGYVGIGLAGPHTRLHVANSSESNGVLITNDTTGHSANDGLNLQLDGGSRTGRIYLRESGSLILGTSAVDRVTIDSSGNMGIGTTGPNTRLHVANGADSNGILITNTTTGHTPNDGLNIQLDGETKNGRVYLREAGSLILGTSTSDRVIIDSSGNVGIGTSSPTSKLHVSGNTLITGNITVEGNIAAKYQDVAEWVDAVETLDAGTVVVIDSTATNRVAAAAKAYDAGVAGAVSPQPGLVLGEPGAGKALIAQSGRVRIKADARYGAIRPGDLLVTSPTKGHAMRSRPVTVQGHPVHRPGTLIGKALEALPAGRGEILVLLTLQ